MQKISVLLFLLISTSLSRPTFQRDIANVAPDSDGFYRLDTHGSTLPDQGFHVKYAAKLVPGIINLDAEDAVDKILCNGTTYWVKTTREVISNWKIGDTLVGGSEWGCKNELGHLTMISANITNIIRVSEGVYQITGIFTEATSLFEDLDLTMSFAPKEVEKRIVARDSRINFVDWPQTVYPGTTVRFKIAIDNSKVDTDEKIKIKWKRTDPDPFNDDIGEITGTATYFDWVVPDVKNPVWENSIVLKWGCILGVCTKDTESPKFTIYKEVLDWSYNYDSATQTVIDPKISLLDLNCGTAADGTADNSCKLPGFQGKIDLSCVDCYAAVKVGVEQISLKTSGLSVRDFTFNGTVAVKANLQFLLDNDFQYSGKFLKNIMSTKLWGLPNFNVAGISISLGVYLDLDFMGNFTLSGQMTGNLTASADVTYALVHNDDNNLAVKNTGDWEKPKIDFAGNAHLIARTSIVPKVRIGILTWSNALYAQAEPWAKLDAVANYPALPALEALPAADPLVKFGEDVCLDTHIVEVVLTGGVDWSAGVHIASINIDKGGTFIEKTLVAGCAFPLSGVTRVELTFPEETVTSLGANFIPTLKKELSSVLNNQPANNLLASDSTTTVNAVFITSNGDNDYAFKLAAAFDDQNSKIYTESVVLKQASYSLEVGASGVVIPSLILLLFVLLG